MFCCWFPTNIVCAPRLVVGGTHTRLCTINAMSTHSRRLLELAYLFHPHSFLALCSFKHLQLCLHQSTSSLITHFAVSDCTRHQQTPNETTRDFEESSEQMREKKYETHSSTRSIACHQRWWGVFLFFAVDSRPPIDAAAWCGFWIAILS